MSENAPQIAFLSRMAYGDGAPAGAVPAVRRLVDLHTEGRIRIGPNILPELLPEVPAQLEQRCRALVCRPTWGGRVSEELVARLRVPGEPFFIATLSSGCSHIAVEPGTETEVLNADGANTEQTAELTVFLAICLLRRTLVPMVNMGFGVYDRRDSDRSRSLQGRTWVVVGPGAIGQAVLARAAAMGVGSLRAFYGKFRDMERAEIFDQYPGLAKLDDEFGVQCEGNLDRALSGADVVSIHVPSNEKTVGMVDESWFRLLSDSAVLVNSARHEVVDETALIAALEGNRLQGFASDVLPTDSERRGANPHNPGVELWRRACWSLITSIERCTHWSSAFEQAARTTLAESFMQGALAGERNMVYTPHLGGSTRDAEEEVARKAVDALLDRLGVAT